LATLFNTFLSQQEELSPALFSPPRPKAARSTLTSPETPTSSQNWKKEDQNLVSLMDSEPGFQSKIEWNSSLGTPDQSKERGSLNYAGDLPQEDDKLDQDYNLSFSSSPLISSGSCSSFPNQSNDQPAEKKPSPADISLEPLKGEPAPAKELPIPQPLPAPDFPKKDPPRKDPESKKRKSEGPPQETPPEPVTPTPNKKLRPNYVGRENQHEVPRTDSPPSLVSPQAAFAMEGVPSFQTASKKSLKISAEKIESAKKWLEQDNSSLMETPHSKPKELASRNLHDVRGRRPSHNFSSPSPVSKPGEPKESAFVTPKKDLKMIDPFSPELVPETPENSMPVFKTPRGKDFSVSAEALAKAQRLFGGEDSEDLTEIENELSSLKTKSRANLATSPSASSPNGQSSATFPSLLPKMEEKGERDGFQSGKASLVASPSFSTPTVPGQKRSEIRKGGASPQKPVRNPPSNLKTFRSPSRVAPHTSGSSSISKAVNLPFSSPLKSEKGAQPKKEEKPKPEKNPGSF